MRFLPLLCLIAAAAAAEEPALRGAQVAGIPTIISAPVTTTTVAVVAMAPVSGAMPATTTTTSLLSPVSGLISPFTSILTAPLSMISPMVSPILSFAPTGTTPTSVTNITETIAGVPATVGLTSPITATGGVLPGVIPMPGAPVASVQAAFTDMRFTPGPLAFLPNADAGLRQYLRVTPVGSLPLPLPAGAVPPPLPAIGTTLTIP